MSPEDVKYWLQRGEAPAFPTSITGHVRTERIDPPIPTRLYDWSAWVDGEEEQFTGYGPTEAEALRNLAEQLAERVFERAPARCQTCDGRGKVNADHEVDGSGRTVACTVSCEACNGKGATQ